MNRQQVGRKRRSRAEVEVIKSHIYDFCRDMQPVTVRQIFYYMTTTGLIDKTENEYRKAVSYRCGKMRDEGELPWEWIEDETRWMRKPDTHNSLEDALRLTAETYRKNLWLYQPAKVEIWLEKNALAGVIVPVTNKWDVALMPTKGYPSKTFLHNAAVSLGHTKPAYIYYFGDFDPTGEDISRNVDEGLRCYAADADISFYNMAVTEAQIEAWDLPDRPTKKSDPRAKKFGSDKSVELDAIPPDLLRGLVEGCIESQIDWYQLNQAKAIEAAEHESMQTILESFSYQN